ncbi:MAG TPA: sphingomyelin phosphodiesterase [Polyangiaceae bacterium]|nr:sphingomyelin phosphodiesterase [Polyangiaceae bacterium]
MGHDSRLSALSRRRFLKSVAAAGGALGCAEIPPVTRPDPARFDACPNSRALSILTWNIFMMPEWIKESPFNQSRARAIAATLLEQQFDILCLQKVFDRAALAILENALGRRYPHRYGPANDGCLLLSSGVWVLSRYPLVDYQQIEFSECSSWECFARKGALLLSGTCGKTPFRLVTTHLQGEEGSSFTRANQAVRDRQMRQIRDRLIVPHLEAEVPFIICGDFGTPRFAKSHGDETDAYRSMLTTLGVENGATWRITLDEIDSQLAKSASARRNELEYVFVRKNGFPLEVERMRHVFERDGWDPKQHHTDLSYRYAVSAKLSFGQA